MTLGYKYYCSPAALLYIPYGYVHRSSIIYLFVCLFIDIATPLLLIYCIQSSLSSASFLLLATSVRMSVSVYICTRGP